MWEVQICLDVSLTLYVALLVVAKQRRAEVVKRLRSMETRRQSAKEQRSIESRRQTVEEPRSSNRCAPGAAATDARR